MSDPSPYLKTITTSRNLSDGIATATQYELHQNLCGEDKVVARYLDYGTPAQRVKTYEYYTSENDYGYGKLAKRVDFDGKWTKYEYDISGRLIKEISPFGDASDTAPENQCQVITYDYTKLDNSESSDDSAAPRWRRRIVTICGQETARQYRQFFAEQEKIITATSPGAAWNAANNKVETTDFVEDHDPFCEEDVRRDTAIENTDGFVEEISYVDDLYELSNPSQTIYTICKTTIKKFSSKSLSREVEVKNHFGTVESYRRYDLTGAAEILAEGYDQTIDRFGRPLTKTDIDGNVTTYEYYSAQIQDGNYTNDIPFDHVKTTKPDGSVLLEAFDTWGDKIFSSYDGITTFYHYDAFGNVVDTIITGCDNGTLTTSTAYNDDDVKISETDAKNNTTTYSYGAGWDMRTDALGNMFRNEYYLDGRLKNVKVNGNVKTYYTYEIIDNELVTTEYKSAAEWSKSIIGFDGNIRCRIYSDGYVENFSYDEYGRQIATTDNCNNNTEYAYNQTTGKLCRQLANGVQTEFSSGHAADEDTGEIYHYERTYSYYQNNPVLTNEIRTYRNGRKTREFNAGKTVFSVKTYLGSGVTAETKTENGVISTNTYLNERLVATQNAASGFIEYVYDEFNRLLGFNYTENSTAKTLRNVLDANGNVLSVTQSAGNAVRTVSYLYDALNRKTAETTPEGQTVTYTYDAQGNITGVSGDIYPQEYTYDIQGRITGITTCRSATALETTTFTYDDRGRMRSRIYPDNATEQFFYRGDGSIDCVINARGQTIRCTYDRLNRLASIQGAGIYWEFAYDYRNLPIRACDGNYFHNLGYDEYGNLVSENFSDIPGTEIAYSYDEYKRFTGYSFDGAGVDYSYSPYTGILERIDSGNWSFVYNRISGGDRLAQTIAKRNNQIVHSVIRNYNALGDLTDIGGYGYTVNLDGRRETATQLDGRIWSYTYDNLNQVIAGVLRDGNNVISNHSYAYDRIGNRTSATDNGVTRSYTANDLNQYTAVGDDEYVYDADGNLLDDGNFTYEYDALNQLVSVSTATDKEVFVYDFMGRRIATDSFVKSGNDWSKSSRRRYIYQGWNVIAEYVNSACDRSYVWGEDLSGTLQGAGGVGGLLLERNTDGEYLPVYDGNGNIISYKDDAGSVVSTYAYDPFGNVIAHAGMDFVYKFSTKPQDNLSGMYYYGYRFYQPMIGRWNNREPLKGHGNSNLYSTNNNLILFWDIKGLYLQRSDISDAISGGWAFDSSDSEFAWVINVNFMFSYTDERFSNAINSVKNKFDVAIGDCGSEVWQRILIPDSPFGFNFSDCCKEHDDCYDKQKCDREICDTEFYKCMKKVVEADKSWYKFDFLGYFAADIFYAAVNKYGAKAYENANKNKGERK